MIPTLTRATALLFLALLAITTPQTKADGVLCNLRDFLGSYNTPGRALGVTVVGTTAYVADGDSGLQIIDVSNPALPTLLGSYDTPGRAEGVAVVGTTAYVADGFFGGLQIIDVSDCPPCSADLTNDGQLDFFDVAAFLNAFAAEDPAADFTGDGVFDFFDVNAFLSAFSAGCP